MKKIWLVVVMALCGSLEAFEPHPVTPYPVLGYREYSFFDDFYHVNRVLLAWYPVDPLTAGTPSKNPWDVFNVAVNAFPAHYASKRPIVIISHGYTGNPHQLSWLIRGLVHAGFIVLGIEHRDLFSGKVHANHWQRAMDVRTVIEQFTMTPMSNTANLNQIGIAGFSLGGTTAIWVAGGRSTKLDSLVPSLDYAAPEDYVKADEALPTLNKEMMAKDWREPRVKAAFVMAPAWSWLFNEESLHKVTIPVYLIAAEADRVLVTKNNAGFFARNIPNAIYQEIPGKANHYIFISAVSNDQRRKIDSANKLSFLFEEDTTVDRAWIQYQVVTEAAAFFRSVFNAN